jgi:hypothetical protein
MHLPTLSTGRVAATVTIACSLALVPALGRAAAGTVPRCAAASLMTWVGRTTGAAGSNAAEFGFTNHSASTCSLQGYPVVQMLKKSGTDLSTSDQKAPGAFKIQVKAVALVPGKTAYFGVVYATQTGYANLTCPTSAALRLTPPQDSGTLTLHGSHGQITPYGGGTQHLKCGIVHVTAVTAIRFQ